MICIRRYIDKPFLEWYFDKRGVDRNSRDGKFLARWRTKKDVFRVLIPHGDSEFFLCPTLVTTRKASFLKEVSVECNQNLNLSQLLQFDYLQKLSVCLFICFRIISQYGSQNRSKSSALRSSKGKVLTVTVYNFVLKAKNAFKNSIILFTYSSSKFLMFLKAFPFIPFMSLSFRRLRYSTCKPMNNRAKIRLKCIALGRGIT